MHSFPQNGDFEAHYRIPVLDSRWKASLKPVPAQSLNPGEIFRRFTCAVVLTDVKTTAGDALLESIRRSELQTEFLTHPLSAWASLLRLEMLGADTEHGTARRTALFVLDRDGWDDLSLLFTRIRGLLPDVSIWIIADALAIEVYSGVTHHAGLGAPIEIATPNQSSGNAPALRIVGNEVEEAPIAAPLGVELLEDGDSPEPDPDAVATNAVSSEELAMLLELFDEDTPNADDPKRAPRNDGNRSPPPHRPERGKP